MTQTPLTLFCLVEGETTSRAFYVEIPSSYTIYDLKSYIYVEIHDALNNVGARNLILWRASIPDDKQGSAITVEALGDDDKTELNNPRTQLSKFFAQSPDDNTYIIIQRPQENPLDTSISLQVFVEPGKNVAFTWSTVVDEATLNDFKHVIFVHYPQYADDKHLEIFEHYGQHQPVLVSNNEGLRRILKTAKTTSQTELTVSLETRTKDLSAWTFEHVCYEFKLSNPSDPTTLEGLAPFTEIQAAALDSDFEKKALPRLKDMVGTFVDVLRLDRENVETMSLIVGVFLAEATRLFKQDLYLFNQQSLSGSRGEGLVDFSVHSRKHHRYTLIVTQVKWEKLMSGVARNIVQLATVMTQRKKHKKERTRSDNDSRLRMARKRKRGLKDVVIEEDQPMAMKLYGIVTDVSTWILTECTLHEDDRVTYRMTELERTINLTSNWQDNAEFIFKRLVWLWSRMVDDDIL